MSKKLLILPLIVYVLWTLATYLLEGYPRTFLEPDAVLNRVVYIVIANFIIGIIISMYIIKHLISQKLITLKQAGFRSIKNSLISMVIGLILGGSIYFLQNPPSTHPIIVVNAFFQVLSVSIAEVIVCWSVVGSSFDSGLKRLGNKISTIAAMIISTLLFGFYHYAHSPPFNTIHMVLFLSVIGLFTGLFFFISRNIYATIIFHNFFGIKGVIQALDQADKLSGYKDISLPVLITALIAVSILAVMHNGLKKKTSAIK